MDHVLARVSSVARAQFGLVHRTQVFEAGGTRWTWRRWLADGVLEPVGVHVARFAGVPAIHEQRLMAAMLDAGPEAVVSFRAACWLYGFDGVVRGPVELTVPPEHRYRRPGVITHVSTLDPADVWELHGFRVTSPIRTAIDMAQLADRRVLEHVVDSVLRRLDVDEVDLRRRLARIRRQGRGGVVLLDEVLDGRPGGGLHSVLEREFMRIVRAAGLPDPASQVPVVTGSRTRRVDFCWADLVVEVSGHRTHSSRAQRRGDAERQRALVAEGKRVVEFTSDEVFDDASRVVRELRTLLISVPRTAVAEGSP